MDGAFTKLFCEWDAAGSDRFVRNCACYLAADMSALDPELAATYEPPAGALRPGRKLTAGPAAAAAPMVRSSLHVLAVPAAPTSLVSDLPALAASLQRTAHCPAHTLCCARLSPALHRRACACCLQTAGAGAAAATCAGLSAGSAVAGGPRPLPTYDAATLAEVLSHVRTGGGTALHDAILAALDAMQADHDAYHARVAAKHGADAVRPRCLQLVVVTDGEDGHSAGSAAAVAERLRAPGLWAARSHFRATLVGVGAEAAAALAACSARCKHVRVVDAADGGEGIRAAFKRVVEHMQEAVVTTVETTTTATAVPLPGLPRGAAPGGGGGGGSGAAGSMGALRWSRAGARVAAA